LKVPVGQRTLIGRDQDVVVDAVVVDIDVDANSFVAALDQRFTCSLRTR